MKNTRTLFIIAIIAILTFTGCERNESTTEYTDLQKQEFDRVLEARKAEEAKKQLENRIRQLQNEILDFGENVYYFKNEQFGNTLALFIKKNPNLKIVSICGDSAGSSHSSYSQGALSRHNGYWVVAESK